MRLTTLLAVALLGLGIWLMVSGGPTATAQRSPAPPVASASPTLLAASRPPTTESPSASPGPRVIPDGYRVQVPRLRIDLPIKEGDVERDTVNQQTPENAAFHLPRTAIPGDGSNTYVYAHARAGMFLSLWQAKEGDDVLVITPDGKTLQYVVREVHPRVPFNEISWVLPTTSERLTLQTSTGPNPQDPRFVVVALPKT